MATTLDHSRLRALQPEQAGSSPLYLQLVERLETAIASGLYKDGDSLPPVRVLAENLDVSRTTVRKALDELIRRGRVVSRHGSGNFIASRFEQPLAADAVSLALPAGTPVMATMRQGFLADDRPIEFTRSIYRADRYDFVAEMRLGQG